MIAETAPAMEQERTPALALLVSEMDIVEPPGGIHAGHAGVLLLLPVEPPEIDALFFQRVQHEIEIVLRELLAGDVEGHVFSGPRIDAHGPGHDGVILLPRLNA